MKSEKQPPSKVSLDDLFALKRAEQPPEDFWQDFQRDFHVRQRAEAIEPKRWWFVLPRIFAGFSHYQMPIGAAAVLAVTFLSFREYREPGFEVAYSTPQALPVAIETSPEFTAEPIASIQPTETPAIEASDAALLGVDVVQIETVIASAETPAAFELSPMVVWAGPSGLTAESIPAVPTASERSIAANLATVEAEQLQVGRLLGVPELDLAASVSQSATLGQVSIPEPTRQHLFVYQSSPTDFSVEREQNAGRDTHSLIADRISHDELYDSVSRVSAGGNHLTVKF